jgi:hypothetical protein
MASEIEYTGQIIREAPEVEALKLGLATGGRDFVLGKPTLFDAQGNQIQARQGTDGQWRYTSGANNGQLVPPDIVNAGSTARTGGYDLAEELRAANEEIGKVVAGTSDLPRLTAGLSPLQERAISEVRQDLAAGQGIGGYQPLLNSAGERLSTGMGTLAEAAGNVSGMDISGAYDPAKTLMGQAAQEAGALSGYENLASAGLGAISQGIGGVEQAAQRVTSGLDTIAGGTARVGQAADQAGQFLQADLAPSQGLLGQGAQATRQALADYSQSRGAVGQGLGTAGGIAEAGMPGQQRAQSTLEQGIGTVAGATEGYDPTSASRFMNPYQEEVTRKALAEMRRQADIAENQAAAQAVRAGAFGGTREGVQRAESERNVQDIMSQRIMQDYAQNYGQAQQAAMQAFEQQQGRELGAGQAMGQMGGLQSQVGSQTAALLAQEAGLQGQLGSQLGAMTGQETQLELQRGQQLSGIGQLLGAQELQQTQIGQAGTQLQGQLGMQEAQLGLLPAQIATQEANINAQLAQTGLLPAQIAQTQASIGAQEAGLYNQIGQGLGSLTGQQTGQELQQQQLYGQMGQQYGQMGMQEAQLAQLQQQAALGDINAIAQLGQLQQGAKQAEISAQSGTIYQQTMAPYQEYGFMKDMASAAPSSQMALTSTSAPQASTAQQIAGLAGAALSGGKALGAF